MNAPILVINPGSTSTKIAVFADTPFCEQTIRHKADDPAISGPIMEQCRHRKALIQAFLKRQGLRLNDLAAIIGRGGLLRPIPGGVYAICAEMLADLRDGRFGVHASNLGALLAHDLAASVDRPCFIADPVVVDELCPLARYSGHPDIRRRSVFHALSHKAAARRAAQELGQDQKKLRLIVAHLGGGISVGAHENGQVVDVNNALDGEGPFSPQRSGGLPVGEVVSWCFAHGASETDIRRRITGQGGLTAYLGTSDAAQISRRCSAGDEQAKEVYAALAYQVAKEIGGLGTVLGGQIDAIILTGGLMHDALLARMIRKRVDFLARVLVYPGEDEMAALADAAKRALAGAESVRDYATSGR